jgi:hypothetical protein
MADFVLFHVCGGWVVYIHINFALGYIHTRKMGQEVTT